MMKPPRRGLHHARGVTKAEVPSLFPSPPQTETVSQIVFHRPGFRGERRRIGGNNPAMSGMLVVRKGNVGDFLNRIGNLASGTTKVNTHASHERITASLCKRTPEPRLEPPPLIATQSPRGGKGDFFTKFQDFEH